MDRQQGFLGALVNKVRSDDVPLNPVKLHPVLDAATSSLTTDPALARLRGLCALVHGMRDLPVERVRFLTVPWGSYAYDAHRDQPVEPGAGRLFERPRTDSPLAVRGERLIRDDFETIPETRLPYPLLAGTPPSGGLRVKRLPSHRTLVQEIGWIARCRGVEFVTVVV
jgi:hypothetical protein